MVFKPKDYEPVRSDARLFRAYPSTWDLARTETEADHAMAERILSVAMKANNITCKMAHDELGSAGGKDWALPGERDVELVCLKEFYRDLDKWQPKDVES